jgi:4-diphosphocytidyl-2-C-methyl-D-erythritol kinase
MAGLTLAAPAKLNLRLLVGPRRADGYHEVRTLVVALEGLADLVTVAPADARAVRCPGLDGQANLAWRALDALERAVGRRLDCAVTIDKCIPAGAGLGGGSSDAATTLVAANRLLGLGLDDAELEAVAAEVGSDVPFFVRGGARWAAGRGERLAPAPAPAPRFAALLAMPREGLSTPAVYAAFDRMPPPPPDDGRPAPYAMPALAAWARNDLWPAALALRPGLGALARSLRSAGAAAALLCGSGSALAGLAGDRAAAERARALLPAGAAAWTAVVTSDHRWSSPAGGPPSPNGWDGR